jgi:hypothetical protein
VRGLVGGRPRKIFGEVHGLLESILLNRFGRNLRIKSNLVKFKIVIYDILSL